MSQENKRYIPELIPKYTPPIEDTPTRLTHEELPGVHHGDKGEEMTTTTHDKTPKEHTDNI